MNAFRRSLFGYRRHEVDAAIAARDEQLAARDLALAEDARSLAWHAGELESRRARIAQLEVVCDLLSDAVAEARAESEAMRDEAERAGAAFARIDAIGAQARGQATRIRLAALRDAAELTERLDELGRAPATARARLLDSLRIAIDRLEGGAAAIAPAAEIGGPRRIADEIFEGLVEVEVGPLDDFSQLVGFEDAAGAIDATSEISVRRFAGGRATLEMKLAEPVDLLTELERRSPFEFRVRDRRFDRLVLDVE